MESNYSLFDVCGRWSTPWYEGILEVLNHSGVYFKQSLSICFFLEAELSG